NKFFGATNSVKHFYQTISYNKFSFTPAPETNVALSGLVNDGVVSVTLNYPHSDPAIAIDDRNRSIARDALIAANPFVDFSQFDKNGDGTISPAELHIVVITAGYERSFTASPCGGSVWGHRWGLFGDVPMPALDGKTVGQSYSQFGEWHCADSNGPGNAATMGIMVHELGHDLGLPDLYDIDGSSEGVGNWSLMATGSWNQVKLAGDSPSHMDPWSKYFLGWISPTAVTATLSNESISASATSDDVYRLLPGTPLTGEYFLVENRQKVNYDAGLPGAGLLIWHIDTAQRTSNNRDNTNECYPNGPSCAADHYLVALVQADNAFDLEKGNNRGDGGDPWPGTSGRSSFNSSSTPNSNLYNGSAGGVSISAIGSSGTSMTATLSVLGTIPTVTIAATDNAATEEGATSGTFTVSRTGAGTTAALTVFYQVAGTATNGADYQTLAGSVTIPAGGNSATVTVTPIDDGTVGEGNETVILNLLANADYILGTSKSATVTIVDKNPPPVGTVQFSAANFSVSEGGGSAAIAITRAGGSNGAISVTVASSNGTATAGSDYTATTHTVSFANGDTATKTVNIPISNDTVFEGDETLNLTLSNPTGGSTLGTLRVAVLTIVDNDLPVVSMAATSSAAEANAVAGIFTVSRTGSTGSPLTVFYQISGTATAGQDYQALAGIVTIVAGQSSATVRVIPIDDGLAVEGNETVTLELQAHAAYALGTSKSGTVTIVDRPPPPPAGTVQFSAPNFSVNEGDGNAVVTITRTGGSNGAIAVTIATSNGTAAAGSDYTATTRTVNFANGDAASKTVSIPIRNDTVFEVDETANLALRNPTGGASLGSPSTAVLAIIDDDPGPAVSINDVQIVEGDSGTSNAVFAVTLAPASNQTVRVSYHTADDTAQAGSDYVAKTSSLTFSPGETSKNITVVVNSDTVPEATESFLVVLSGATNARVARSQGLATIVNDDVVKATWHLDADFDGDGRADIAIYRDGMWFIARSSDGGIVTVGWGGAPQDVPVPADYDGDGKADIAIYRDGVWFIRRSSDDGFTGVGWGGLPQDIPLPGDYDGDGKSDIAVYRDGGWYIIRSSDGGFTGVGWGGMPQDIPLPGDYDGDGKTDIAVYRHGGWYIIRSSDGGFTGVGWGGLVQDIPVPADYDGDGKTDIAVYRDGGWFIIRSSDGALSGASWGGQPQDIPLN
ncbi:MAG: Calx-beta domain-containing protein, partial [Candidatus Binatia bacterium]